MKKILTIFCATSIIASMLVIPVSAQASTQQNNSAEINSSYCDTCNAVGIPYPKNKYNKSDFVGTSIQYQGSTYYYWYVDDNLSTDKSWWVVFKK